MGQFSVEKPGLPGPVLSGNQHRQAIQALGMQDGRLYRDAGERAARVENVFRRGSGQSDHVSDARMGSQTRSELAESKSRFGASS